MTEYYHMKDRFYERSDDKYEFIVTEYTIGDWQGTGEAWGLSNLASGSYVNHYNLGHCSCYGPLDCFGGWDDRLTLEQFAEAINGDTVSLFKMPTGATLEKIKELIGRRLLST